MKKGILLLLVSFLFLSANSIFAGEEKESWDMTPADIVDDQQPWVKIPIAKTNDNILVGTALTITVSTDN
jgi:hypothetical protein